MDWHTITQVLSLDNFLNWLNTLDPLVVHLINALVLFIEGIGVPGVPFEPPMLAAGILVHQGKTTLIESILWGGVANWLGNIGGYYLGGRGMKMLPERIRGNMGIEEVRGWLARRRVAALHAELMRLAEARAAAQAGARAVIASWAVAFRDRSHYLASRSVLQLFT